MHFFASHCVRVVHQGRRERVARRTTLQSQTGPSVRSPSIGAAGLLARWPDGYGSRISPHHVFPSWRRDRVFHSSVKEPIPSPNTAQRKYERSPPPPQRDRWGAHITAWLSLPRVGDANTRHRSRQARPCFSRTRAMDRDGQSLIGRDTSYACVAYLKGNKYMCLGVAYVFWLGDARDLSLVRPRDQVLALVISANALRIQQTARTPRSRRDTRIFASRNRAATRIRKERHRTRSNRCLGSRRPQIAPTNHAGARLCRLASADAA